MKPDALFLEGADEALAEAVQGRRAVKAIVDRGYRGHRWVGETEVLTPNRPPAGQSKARSAECEPGSAAALPSSP